MGAEFEVVDSMNAGQSRRVGRMSGDAEHLPSAR